MNSTYYKDKTQDGRSDTGKQLAGGHAGQFGEFDESGIGTDLTLEWDSTDPDLHAHLRQADQTDEDDAENHSWHRDDMGIPDA